MTDRPTIEATADRPTGPDHRALVGSVAARPQSTGLDRPDPTTDTRPDPTGPRRLWSRSTDQTAPTPTDRGAEKEPTALRVGLTVVLWVQSAVATLMAASGQLGFADWAEITGPQRYGVPVLLELFAVILMLLGYRQGRRKRSPYPLWLLASVVGAFSVYTNVVHAGHRAGLVYGAASAATLIAWLVKLRLDLTHFLEKIRHIPPARAKLGALWLVAPRIARRAKIVSVRRGIVSREEVVTLAEVWNAIYDDMRSATVKRGLAKRTAWRTVYQMSGGPVVELPRTAEIATVEMTTRPTVDPTAQPTGAPTAEPTDTDSSEPTERRSRPERPADRKPTAKSSRSGGKPTDSGIRLVWSPTVCANAAALRARYGDRLPALGTVRKQMDWSYDRAKPAVAAYHAGADQQSGDAEERAS